MMNLRALLLVLLIPTLAVGQPCPGDENGDRQVTIAELVAAVNAALNGCDRPVPTPTVPLPDLTCPVRFTGDNTADEDPVCQYQQLAAECRNVEYEFYTDGSFVIVVVFNDTFTGYFGALVNDGLLATIFARWTEQDVSDYRAATGIVRLRANDHLFLSVGGGVICGMLDGRSTERRFPPRGAIRAMLNVLHNR